MPMGPGTFRQRGGVGEGDWMIKLILLWEMILKTTEPGGALVDQSQIYFTLEFRPEMRPAISCNEMSYSDTSCSAESSAMDFYCWI